MVCDGRRATRAIGQASVWLCGRLRRRKATRRRRATPAPRLANTRGGRLLPSGSDRGRLLARTSGSCSRELSRVVVCTLPSEANTCPRPWSLPSSVHTSGKTACDDFAGADVVQCFCFSTSTLSQGLYVSKSDTTRNTFIDLFVGRPEILFYLYICPVTYRSECCSVQTLMYSQEHPKLFCQYPVEVT